MQHWYVYYKIRPELREDTIAKVRRLQQLLVQSCGVRGRIVERNGGDAITLMEIYEHADATGVFEAQLEEALSRSGLSADLRAARRVECFRDVG